jgi:DASS family divalent anion:Na+ symporter
VTGLGERIALFFVRLLGRSSLGLGYGMTLTDLVLAPATPSTTARSGAIVYPLVRSLSELSGSIPNSPTRRRLGAYLSFTSLQINGVTGAMFATAMAANPIIQSTASDQGVELSWAKWAVAAIVPGLISLAVLPWLIYKIFPPEQKETPEAPAEAVRRLAERGAMNRGEWVMAGTFVLLLVLWSAGDQLWDVSGTAAAFVGISILLVTKTLTWDDIASDKSAWTTLIWFAVLVMMAGQLNRLGVVPWFSEQITDWVGGLGWLPAFIVISVVYLYVHYFFASTTAHVTALYGAFLAASIAAGADPTLAALVLAFGSNLCAGLTHYASGPAPVHFGSGYTTMGEWWRNAFVVSVANLVIWMGVGSLWLKVLGDW